MTLFAITLAGCSGESGAAPPEGPTAEGAAAESAPELAVSELYADADRRELTARLRRGLTHPEPRLRRAAYTALARLHDPAQLPRLLEGLRDPDGAVRRAASMGVGALEAQVPSGGERALLGALAAASDVEDREALLLDLGRIGGDSSTPALREALAGPEQRLRVAACRAVGSHGLRSTSVPESLLALVGTRAAEDGAVEVRRACAYALTRARAPAAVRSSLLRAATDEDAEVRAMAVRALGRMPEPALEALARATADADWQVSVQAFRALSRTGSEVHYAQSLGAQLERGVAEERLEGPVLHVLLAALEGGLPMARTRRVHEAAQAAYERLGRVSRETATADQGRAHCAAAKLLDATRGWPSRLQACGFEKVPEATRQVMMVQVLSLSETAHEERGAFFRRLWARGHVRVKQTILSAVPTLLGPSGTDLALQGLLDGDTGVVTTACEAVAEIAGRWAELGNRTGRAGSRLLPRPEPARVQAAMQASHTLLTAADDLEGLQAWTAAAAALGSDELVQRIRALALHRNPAVRGKAREVLGTLDEELPEGEVPGPANPIAPDELDALPVRGRVTLETSRGPVVIELATSAAPTTSARFLGLARQDYYDGLTFHRVVAAFVAQGGDPRGDGYGGPGWAQRCEDNRLTYERGTVGMALAGRDTGGSQFFIAHGAQPHLNGRYTVFGRVVEGMEFVDRLQEGDIIRDVIVGDASSR